MGPFFQRGPVRPANRSARCPDVLLAADHPVLSSHHRHLHRINKRDDSETVHIHTGVSIAQWPATGRQQQVWESEYMQHLIKSLSLLDAALVATQVHMIVIASDTTRWSSPRVL
jgi:hypothetical protein